MYATIKVVTLDKIIVIGDFICIQITRDEVMQNTDIDARMGHGLISTIWNW